MIENSAAARGAEVLARFIEVESGRKADRPELAKALHLAKVTGATLVIAKLDRLSRNAAFLLALRDSGVRFVAVDMPEAIDLTVGIIALVAQAESRLLRGLVYANAGEIFIEHFDMRGRPLGIEWNLRVSVLQMLSLAA